MMRLLTAEYFAKSPVLILPIIALFLFLAVFVGVALRTYSRKKEDFDALSKMPLDEGEMSHE